MNKKNIVIKYMVVIIVCGFFMFINKHIGIIAIPKAEEMVDYQFNLFTISSVFAGFAFTMLGMLLGMSSESLMRSIRNTDIIVKKCGKIVFGIICFCSSGVYSLFLVLKVDIFVNKIFRNRSVSEMLFVLVIGFLIIGLIYFIVSVKELASLIKRIYGYDKGKIKKEKTEFDKLMKDAEERRKNLDSKFIE